MFRATELPQQPDTVRVTRSPLAGVDVVLEIAEAFGNVLDRPYRNVSKRRAPEIGVQNYSRGVDYASQRWTRRVMDGRGYRVDPLLLGSLCSSRAARSLDRGSHCVENDAARVLLEQRFHARSLEQPVDTRQVASGVGHRSRGGGTAGGLVTSFAGGTGGGGGAGTVYVRSLSPVGPRSRRISH